jgi:hypothetical protein
MDGLFEFLRDSSCPRGKLALTYDIISQATVLTDVRSEAEKYHGSIELEVFETGDVSINGSVHR